MPRVADVIDETTMDKQVDIPVPDGAEFIQVVIERQPFESIRRIDEAVCNIELWNGSDYMGGAQFRGGEIRGDELPNRPGQRMLWSYYKRRVGAVKTYTLKVTAPQPFPCNVHVDFTP